MARPGAKTLPPCADTNVLLYLLSADTAKAIEPGRFSVNG